jgi:alpha-beta hydrolase superfamily lysophospholipase
MEQLAQVAHVVTDDGWRLAVHRYAPLSPGSRRHPVVLCHGLASSHLAFDVHPDVSLARHLARRGYLTLAVDLRGHGHSERPTRTGVRRFGWSFDDYLTFDVPAALAYAKHAAGAAAVHWIGHSMGGILGYAHLARGGSADVRSMIAVGSSLDYSGAASGFHALVPFRRWLQRVPAVPVDWLGRVAAALAGRVETPFERFNVWPSNIDRELWRRLARSGFHAVSPPVMGQLATAMAQGGLRSHDGSVAYVEGLAAATAPVLALAGSRDAQCPPEAARTTLYALASARRELRVFGRQHGHADEYGHFDLLMGRRARQEVFAHVDRWLDEHDRAAGGSPSP